MAKIWIAKVHRGLAIVRPADFPWRVALAVLAFGAGELSPGVGAAESDVVAVYASVSPAYHRVKAANGAYQSETYAFGNGGYAPGDLKDPSIEHLDFMDVARTVAPSLASQSYVPCDPKNPTGTQLLIMVYWGTTVRTDNTAHSGAYQIANSLVPGRIAPPPPPPDGANDPAMVRDPTMSGRQQEAATRSALQNAADSSLQASLLMSEMANQQRDHTDEANAIVLGYADELARVRWAAKTPFQQSWHDVLDEVEEGRYYVVLLAYDFQLLWKHHERRILWQTRFSVRERGNAFDQQLARMALAASKYYGQDSGGLHRRPLPDANITIGPLHVVEEHSESAGGSAPAGTSGANPRP